MTACRADLRAMPPELAPFPTRTPRMGAVGGSILIPAVAFAVAFAALRKWWR